MFPLRLGPLGRRVAMGGGSGTPRCPGECLLPNMLQLINCNCKLRPTMREVVITGWEVVITGLQVHFAKQKIAKFLIDS